MEGFEVFEKSRKRAPGEPAGPRATVAVNGNITLNDEGLALYGDKKPGFVQLLYNRGNQVVALKPTNDDDVNGYKLRESPNTKSRTVGAKSFFAHYGIELARASHTLVPMGDAVAFSMNPENQLTAEASAATTSRKR